MVATDDSLHKRVFCWDSKLWLVPRMKMANALLRVGNCQCEHEVHTTCRPARSTFLADKTVETSSAISLKLRM